MTPVLLALLAIVDAAFAGFRASAGRNARVFKRDYYRRHLLRGTLSGLVLVVLLGSLTLLVLGTSADATRQYADLVSVGQRMLWVFVPYAGLVLTALVVYAVADYDLRAFATVAILGPFTLIRPWVIALGSLVGLSASHDWRSWLLAVTASGGVVLLGIALDRSGRLWLPQQARTDPPVRRDRA